MNSTFLQIALATNILPYLTAAFLRSNGLVNIQALTLIPCISLLLLGIALATLSTLNFSLGLLVGLAASPLSLIHAHLLLPEAASTTTPKTSSPLPIRAISTLLLLHVISPTSITYLASHLLTAAPLGDVQSLLVMASEAWLVHSTYTAVIVWLVWFPAWFVGASVVACGVFGGRENGVVGEARKGIVEGPGDNKAAKVAGFGAT
jgi:glycosylphosphatidylinositol transamidase